ncbi:MAG: hypothetical protein HYU71_15300 [Bacteroidetes bacterium]|nr:hypothetical protein [Bacteroidota bacterium]
MRDFDILLVSACSILLPLIAAAGRYRRLSYRYAPLVILLLAGTVNELISYAAAHWWHNNQVNANCYTLIEYLLLLWQLLRMQAQEKMTLTVAAFAGLIIWLTDNVWLHGIDQANVWFRISASLIMVYFSIDTATQLLLGNSTPVLQKTDLALCLAFFVYHTYRSFILLFSFFASHPFSVVSRHLWLALAVINILIHITYTIAILWIPKQPSTSNRYS